MQSQEIRTRFIEFFKNRREGVHAIIPSASLVTPDEKGTTNTTLFNTAGMQPLIPYLLGEPHPQGTRVASIQKCVRTVDIDEVGDNTHATFFEMLGNWSFGDYFKKEAITWSFQFLTSKEEGLGLDPARLYVTVFEGDERVSKDTDSASIWASLGIPQHRIYFKNAASNWWPAVKSDKKDTWTGPTGPCTEMFYDITPEGLGDLSPEEFDRADAEQKVVEIWNDVFMEFEKENGDIVATLKTKNVDTGAGLERLTAVIQKVQSIFDTDLFKPLIDLMKKAENSERNKRIIADHIKASIFLIADGVVPSNTDRGYIVRRLIRRAVMSTTDKKLDEKRIGVFVDTVVEMYKAMYPELVAQRETIKNTLNEECAKFGETLVHGMKEFEKNISGISTMSGEQAFNLYQSYGFPIELTTELAKERGVVVDISHFETLFKDHQRLSRAGAEQKFKGGLSDSQDPQVIKYHTATHLLHQALRDVLGDHIEQRGSNITPERLRFDFSHPQKMTDEEKKEVERMVNEKIAQNMPVQQIVLPREEAEKMGARHLFNEKYGEQVSVYVIGKTPEEAYSKEFCGGPHVAYTGELGVFKIQKEEAVSAGVRRIKAILV